jgi:homoserine acetyltransferase
MDPPKISPPMQHFSLGNFTTQAGDQIPDCQIAYKTWGNPNLPLILYPTWYSGAIEDNEWLIGDKSKSLNPEKFFIIVVRNQINQTETVECD